MMDQRKIISNFLDNINPKKVLDLGCGKGNVSSRFFNKNIPVTGIDKKDFEIKNDNFNFIKLDLREFAKDEKYDLVICSVVLHFFLKEEAEKVIKKMKQSTNEKAYNLLVCMSDKDDLSKNNENKFYPLKKELFDLYHDWEIVDIEQDFTDFETHGKTPPHRHNLIIMLARKKD